jgi:hypothetical protein
MRDETLAAKVGERDKPAVAEAASAGWRAKPLSGVAGFRLAARSVTQRAEPKISTSRRRRSRGDGDRFGARILATDYLELCHNPTKDLRRWIAEDKRFSGRAARGFFFTVRETRGHASAIRQTTLANADRLCRQPLQELRGGLDADGQRGRRSDRVPSRPGAGVSRYDELRQVRKERRGTGVSRDGPDSFAAANAAIHQFYSAKIEATRRRMPAREVSAAIRALLDEQSAAFRALAERKKVVRRTMRERRRTALHAAKEATQRQRPPSRAGPS